MSSYHRTDDDIWQSLQFSDSAGFKAGQEHERLRICQVIDNRISTLRDYGKVGGVSSKTVGALVSELTLLVAAIEEAG